MLVSRWNTEQKRAAVANRHRREGARSGGLIFDDPGRAEGHLVLTQRLPVGRLKKPIVIKSLKSLALPRGMKPDFWFDLCL
jgi:hypothetical protein